MTELSRRNKQSFPSCSWKTYSLFRMRQLTTWPHMLSSYITLPAVTEEEELRHKQPEQESGLCCFFSNLGILLLEPPSSRKKVGSWWCPFHWYTAPGGCSGSGMSFCDLLTLEVISLPKMAAQVQPSYLQASRKKRGRTDDMPCIDHAVRQSHLAT